MLRHGLTAARAARRGRGARPSTRDGAGSRASPCTCRWPRLPPRRGAPADRTTWSRPALARPRTTSGSSHLTDDELAALRRRTPTSRSGPRIGTGLWLGDRGALQRDAPPCSTCTRSSAATSSATAAAAPRKAGHILVVSGGTAHGIGLEAPTGERLAQGPGRHPGPRRPRRGRLRALAVHHRRQAAALRRAAAHAGLDAVPARRRARCPRSATRSTCGCASPPRRSTASLTELGDLGVERAGSARSRTGSCRGRRTSRTTIADQVELGGHPDHDRQPVEARRRRRRRARGSRRGTTRRWRSRRPRRPARSAGRASRGRASTASGSSQRTYCGE